MRVKELLEEIRNTRNNKTTKSYITKSQKEEIRVMKTLMNDTEYEVDVYSNNGKISKFNPSNTLRETLSNIIHSTTHISKEESDILMKQYEFNNKEAENLLNISKEFIHTYLETGKKLSLGGREKSDISFHKKTVDSYHISSPILQPDGTYIRKGTIIPTYETIKVDNKCPSWIKK